LGEGNEIENDKLKEGPYCDRVWWGAVGFLLEALRGKSKKKGGKQRGLKGEPRLFPELSILQQPMGGGRSPFTFEPRKRGRRQTKGAVETKKSNTKILLQGLGRNRSSITG